MIVFHPVEVEPAREGPDGFDIICATARKWDATLARAGMLPVVFDPPPGVRWPSKPTDLHKCRRGRWWFK